MKSAVGIEQFELCKNCVQEVLKSDSDSIPFAQFHLPNANFVLPYC